MTYENFAKYFYTKTNGIIKEASDYTGTINILPAQPSFLANQKELSHAVLNKKSDFSPNFELNINVPIKVYEEYFDFMCEKYPELSILFLGSKMLRTIYDGFREVKDDESVMIVMEEFIKTSATELINTGVLVYGN